ncbi:MAG: cellulase family glycosylhydrolase [Reichenbachiella sp.]
MKEKLLGPMRKGLTMFVLGIFMSVPLYGQTGPTAAEVASQMTIGWNHGNSMEVPGDETAWGNPAATQQLIDGVKAAGFNTVRLPCAWDSYANQSTYEIDQAWLARVKEVVDYCYNNDMYVVLNSHWDGGWLEEHPFYANQADVNAKQEAYWTQIANYFSGYDEHLLFAGTNEVRADYADPTSEYIEVQESYNQVFIDAVRATGGKNLDRILIVQTYNTNAWHGLNYFTEPNDTVNDRLFVEIHHYDPYDFTLNATGCTQWDTGSCSWAGASYVEDLFSQIEQRWVNNGIPVIIGEFGASKREGDAQHTAERLEYLEFTVDAAKRHGMIPIYWDNGYAPQFALFDRSNGGAIDQASIDALMAGIGGSNPDINYNLNITVNGSGGVTTNPSGNTHVSGTNITLTATPDAGWLFNGWNGDVVNSSNPLTINITDNVNVSANFIEVNAGGSGSILREYWSNITGTGISDLTGNTNYPNNPSGSDQITTFEGPINWANNYGSRIRGYVHPPVSGSYTFWISGDDNTDLYLSTNDNKANAERVAYVSGWTSSQQWDKFTTQAVTVNLVSGQKYYIEVLHKEGTGGDNVAVAWQGPGISQSVIDGVYLSPFVDTGGTTQYTLNSSTNGSGIINLSPTGNTFDEGSTVTISAIPASGWQFSGWSGDLSDSSNPTSITMNANKSVVASFIESQSTQYTLSINVNGTGSVSLNPTGGVYDQGTVVTITANTTTGNQFDGWSGDLSGNSSPSTITMNSNKSVTASFSETSLGDGCDNPASVSLPYSYDGSGEYCWEITGNISYVNSWGADLVEINGVDYTNTWSNNLPAKQQGKYNVHFIGSADWSHFEASKAANGRFIIGADPIELSLTVYPNPFTSSFQIELTGSEEVLSIEIYKISGQLETVITPTNRQSITIGDNLKSGMYLMKIIKDTGVKSVTLVKE